VKTPAAVALLPLVALSLLHFATFRPPKEVVPIGEPAARAAFWRRLSQSPDLGQADGEPYWFGTQVMQNLWRNLHHGSALVYNRRLDRAFLVSDEIMQVYLDSTRPFRPVAGRLGPPIEERKVHPDGGWVQHFEAGEITWDPVHSPEQWALPVHFYFRP
jgi:hypothetical protein